MTFIGQDYHHPSITPDHKAEGYRKTLYVFLWGHLVIAILRSIALDSFLAGFVAQLLPLYVNYAFYASLHYSAGVAF
jgi:hypothetical protein